MAQVNLMRRMIPNPDRRLARAILLQAAVTAVTVCTTLAAAQAAPPAQAAMHVSPDQDAKMRTAYAICKKIIAVIYPHKPDAIQQSYDTGSYRISAGGKTISFIGYVDGRSGFRSFDCTMTVDPKSESGWILESFRWLRYH
jgi:hypothetical protein